MNSTLTPVREAEANTQQESVQLNMDQYLEMVTSRRSFSVASERGGQFRVLVDNETGDRYCISSQELFAAAWSR